MLLAEEVFESINSFMNLTVNCFTREGIKALFKSVKNVCLSIRCSHKVLQLTIKLDLEYTRVHEQLDTV